jgi:hypothetical protein
LQGTEALNDGYDAIGSSVTFILERSSSWPFASVSIDAVAPDTDATVIFMSDNQHALDPEKALADIQMLVRAALQSADPVVMRHD